MGNTMHAVIIHRSESGLQHHGQLSLITATGCSRMGLVCHAFIVLRNALEVHMLSLSSPSIAQLSTFLPRTFVVHLSCCALFICHLLRRLFTRLLGTIICSTFLNILLVDFPFLPTRHAWISLHLLLLLVHRTCTCSGFMTFMTSLHSTWTFVER